MAKGLRIALLALTSFGCSAAPDPVRLEVYSWWSEEPERLAFEAAKNVHERAHPGVDVLNVAKERADDQRELLAMHLLAGAPPATFTANIGADLLRWSVVDPKNDSLTATSRIRSLAGLFESTGLTRALPDEVKAALHVGPSVVPYGVPINIHRLNVLYYSESKLQSFAAAHGGRNLLDIDTLCPRDPTTPKLEDVEIAVGTDDAFPLILLTFESVLPALAGPDFYEALFRGKRPRAVTEEGDFRVEVRKALACVQYLSQSFAEDSFKHDWSAAVDQVKRDEATFTVMGDWANGQLTNELLLGTVKAVPFPRRPEVPETFVFTSDTFPLPIGTQDESEVVELLKTFASPDAQRAFSRVKGSIPARLDVKDLGPLDAIQAHTQDDFFVNHAIRKVLATSGLFPPIYEREDLADALQIMTQKDAGPPEVDAALDRFTAMEPLLLGWQRRLEAGPASDFSP